MIEKVKVKLEKFISIAYKEAQEPILMTDLRRIILQNVGQKSGELLHEWVDAGILKITKSYSKKRVDVVWCGGQLIREDGNVDTKLLDELVQKFYNKPEVKKPIKELKKILPPELNPIVEEIPSKVIDEINEMYAPEFDEYKPFPNSLNKIKGMLRVLHTNATDKYCHIDKIFNHANMDDNGVIVNINYKAGERYNVNRLVMLEILAANPDKKDYYKCIINFKHGNEPESDLFYTELSMFANKLSNVMDFLTDRNKYINKRAIRLNKESVKAAKELELEPQSSEVIPTSELLKEIKGLRKDFADFKLNNNNLHAEYEKVVKSMGESNELYRKIAEKVIENNTISNKM